MSTEPPPVSLPSSCPQSRRGARHIVCVGDATATGSATRSRAVTANIVGDATVNSITVTRDRPASASFAGDATVTGTASKVFFFDPALFSKNRVAKVPFEETRIARVEFQMLRQASVPQDEFRNVKVAA